ncbi:hypothetical protein IMZ11_14245 [Microtetraspora sp. AC03309]|uniref:hypothetical protein n=1 Tax=Microtetraspora sp. AC03309 TaxID=2779376 RepID=UPI001E41158A|nr:hypothetical protein [Microtetraspora sp. AC03309]MCC5576792.1 hypothetical protein [Microtetraspora sp. AC03309]
MMVSRMAVGGLPLICDEWPNGLGPGPPEIERGRGDRVLHRIRASGTSWRGW